MTDAEIIAAINEAEVEHRAEAILEKRTIRVFRMATVCREDQGHTHNYDHRTVIVRGRIRVTYSYERDGMWFDGESEEYSGGEGFDVRADVRHTLKALAPDTVYACAFEHRDFAGTTCEVYQGNVHAFQ